MSTRAAMFAGSWYPDDAGTCQIQIQRFLDEGRHWRPTDDVEWVGGIVPHAGWYFSGSIACNVIHCLSQGSPPDVIAVFGRHLHPDSSCYLTKKGSFETPFGELPVAEKMARELNDRFNFSIETSERFTPDNTIELQLPFIKYFFPRIHIVPIGVPPSLDSLTIGSEIAAIARRLGLNLKVIGSTDLTHYGDNYGFTSQGRGASALKWVTEENDRRIIELMLNLDDRGVIKEGLTHHNACCAGAAATAIAASKNLGADAVRPLTYATSYEKSPGDSFVGYVGIVLGKS